MSIKCTVYIQQDGDWYVATDISSGVASQGKTIDESLSNLKEAIELFYENNAPSADTGNVYVTTLEVAV